MKLLKKLLGRGNRAADHLPDMEIEDKPGNGWDSPPSPQLFSGSAVSVGVERDHNEDSLFAMSTLVSDRETKLPFGVFIIADGMGGHQYGEVASSVAARVMGNHLAKKLFELLVDIQPASQDENLQEILADGVKQVQELVARKAPGGGTTLTAAVVIGEQISIAHVGDSRVYLFEDDHSYKVVTQDHTLVHRLVELGQISKDEAEIHPQRNVLYKAIGQNEPLKADYLSLPFPKNGKMLLCSDGLWGVLPEEEMAEFLSSNDSPASICQNLVEAANRHGGPDNISVIVVKLTD